MVKENFEKTADLSEDQCFSVNENERTHTPVSVERLKMAAEEMRDPQFLQRLAGTIYVQAHKSGLLRNKILPGMKTCDDLAMDIVSAVLEGRRKWPPSQSFFEACMSVVKSTVTNWKKKASNVFDWNQVDAAVEEWSEDEGMTRYPTSDAKTPSETMQSNEAAKRFEAEVTELAGMVEAESIEEKLVEELMEQNGCWDRKEFIKKYGVSGSDYEAAIKRLKRLASKIIMQRKD